MTLRALTIALLAACSAAAVPRHDAPIDSLRLGDRVPDEVFDAHASALSDCLGEPVDLDGWSAWPVLDLVQTCSGAPAFVCPRGVRAECPPADAETEARCPCRCAEITSYATQRIAVASVDALAHGMLHALKGRSHEGAWWSCQ